MIDSPVSFCRASRVGQGALVWCVDPISPDKAGVVAGQLRGRVRNGALSRVWATGSDFDAIWATLLDLYRAVSVTELCV